jgi:hypothetical protein
LSAARLAAALGIGAGDGAAESGVRWTPVVAHAASRSSAASATLDFEVEIIAKLWVSSVIQQKASLQSAKDLTSAHL